MLWTICKFAARIVFTIPSAFIHFDALWECNAPLIQYSINRIAYLVINKIDKLLHLVKMKRAFTDFVSKYFVLTIGNLRALVRRDFLFFFYKF